MKTTVIQLDIEWGSPQKNIERVDRLIEAAPGSDLYVLPEMWSTGFATEPVGIAESESTSVSLSWMRTIAETYYDKHHLFTYGHEDRYYQSGDAHSIVEYCGFRILLLTCYDLRFPVWSRYSDALLYDAIIAVANWPESRQNAWQILTRARAMENQAYLIGCNRVGDDQYSHYRGQSAIISPIGKTLASCQPNKEQTVSFTLDLETVCHQRSKFKVLEDRDIR